MIQIILFLDEFHHKWRIANSGCAIVRPKKRMSHVRDLHIELPLSFATITFCWGWVIELITDNLSPQIIYGYFRRVKGRFRFGGNRVAGGRTNSRKSRMCRKLVPIVILHCTSKSNRFPGIFRCFSGNRDENAGSNEFAKPFKFSQVIFLALDWGPNGVTNRIHLNARAVFHSHRAIVHPA